MSDFAIPERALQKLKKLGAKEASLVLSSEESTACDVRQGKVERLQQSQSATLSVQVYVAGRYGVHSTNDLRPAELDAFLQRAVALTRVLEEDPFRKLPDPKLYRDRPPASLPLTDPAYAARTMAERKATAFAMEASARASGKNVISASAGTSDTISDTLMLTSNGFRDRQTTTVFGANVDVTVKDGDKRPEDWAYASARLAGALPDPDLLGQEASARAEGRVGAKKIASGAYPVLVEARAGRTLVNHLLAATFARSLQQKRSFLDGKLGQALFSDRLTLEDDPLIAHGLGSRRFDGEGLSAKRFKLIENGVLKAYYVDWYYGSKLGLEPTTGRPSNLVIAPGSKSLAELERSLDKGIVVTSFIGGNSNSTTGDFSFGLVGHWIEKGVRKHPVSELNLSGNHSDFWKKLAALGNDPWLSSSLRTPSMLFDGAAVSGA